MIPVDRDRFPAVSGFQQRMRWSIGGHGLPKRSIEFLVHILHMESSPDFGSGMVPTPRVAMRNIKEALRLKLDCDLSHERIGRALGLSKGVLSKYVQRAQIAGLDWTVASALDEAQLTSRLCPTTVLRVE